MHFLLNSCRAKFFFAPAFGNLDAIVTWMILSSLASLDVRRSARTILTFRPIRKTRNRLDVSTAVHRFEESIGGHPYLIEVAAIAKDRWRAYIVRMPGVPTALMPFYGATPDEAAAQLCQWLTGAHERAAAGARR